VNKEIDIETFPKRNLQFTIMNYLYLTSGEVTEANS